MMSADIRRYNGSEIICRQGETADRLFILRSGVVGVYVNSNITCPTNEQVLRDGLRVSEITNSGEMIGEGGLFLKTRTASLVALHMGTSIEHLKISGGGLAKIMIQRPELGMTLCVNLANRLRELMDRLGDLVGQAESVQREWEHLATQFSGIIDTVRQRAVIYPDLQAIIDAFEECELYILGRSLQMDRDEQHNLFQDSMRRQRSGQMKIPRGALFIEEGTVGRDLYYIKDGEFEVLIKGIRVGHIRPGEMVGEIAVLLKNHPRRTADVRAVRDSLVCSMPGVEFLDLAKTKPQILVPIAQTLARRLEATNALYVLKAKGRSAAGIAVGDDLDMTEHFLRLSNRLKTFGSCRDLAEQAQHLAQRAGTYQRQFRH